MKFRWMYLSATAVLALALDPDAFGQTVAPEPTIAIALRVDNAEIGPTLAVAMDERGVVTRSGYVQGDFPDLMERVSPARRRRLAGLLKKWHFFEMRGNYGCGVDMPYRRTGAALNGRETGVKFCLGEGVTSQEAEALLRVWWGTVAALSKSGKAEPWASDRQWMGIP